MTKTLGTAKKIKDLPNYPGKFGLYSISKPITRNKIKFNFVIAGKLNSISGPPNLVFYLATEKGFTDHFQTLKSIENGDLFEGFKELGFILE